MKIIFTVLILFLMVIQSHQQSTLQKIYIGRNGTSIQNIFFSHDQLTSATNIPIFLSVIDPGTIVVTCESLTSLSKSVVTFDPLSIIVSATDFSATGNITYKIINVDYPVPFQCYGVGAGYSKGNSMSDIRFVQRVSGSQITFCSLPNYVPSVSTSTKGSFYVKLSAKVVDKEVLIRCTYSKTGTDLTFEDKTVPVGWDAPIEIKYTVASTDLSQSESVTCSSQQSSNSQFSGAVGSDGKFYTNTNTQVTIEPTTFETSSLSVRVTLGITTSEVVKTPFKCAVRTSTTGPVEEYFTDCASVFALTNSTWKITPSEIFIPIGSRYTDIFLTRSKFPTSSSITTNKEYLLAYCCITHTSNQPQGYLDTVVNVTGVADFTTATNLNYVEADGAGSTVDTAIANSAFVNIAPCPCDLTESVCDPGCCCDSLCASTTVNITSCISGMLGGQASPVSSRSCQPPEGSTRPDYHAITCIFFENNALLGMFYPTKASLKTLGAFNSERTMLQTPTFLHVKVTPHHPVSCPTTPRETGTRSYPSSSQSSTAYKLGDPLITRISDVSTTTTSRGILTLPKGLTTSVGCNRGAPVLFMQSTSATCTLTVSKGMCSVENSSLVGLSRSGPQTECSDLYGPLAVKSYLTSSSIIQCPSGTQLLQNAASSASPTVVYAEYHCGSGTPCAIQTAISELTMFDPVWDDANSTCNNVVKSVVYNFTVKSGSIVMTEVTVTLVNESLSSTGASSELIQNFTTVFHEAPSAAVAVATADNSSITQRSGYLGYDEGLPLITGIKSGEVNNFLVDTSQQLSIFKSDSSGLCSNAGKNPIRFKRSSFGGCYVKYTNERFSNCETLRAEVKSIVDANFISNVIAVYGNPKLTNTADWVDIVKDPLKVALNFTDRGFLGTDGLILKLVLCSNITSGIRLVIFYSKQGLARGQPIYQVVGAAVNYTLSDWRPVCKTGADNPCTNPELTSTFLLQASVSFLEVTPAGGFATSDSRICWYGVCWEESFLAWTADDMPAAERMYATSMGCVIVVITIFLFFISHPWW